MYNVSLSVTSEFKLEYTTTQISGTNHYHHIDSSGIQRSPGLLRADPILGQGMPTRHLRIPYNSTSGKTK